MAEHTNRLIDETSPYLRQHAHNPVAWYPWGDEALSRARAEDKPILLSIGYSACHWCHVMAHESFENEAIAAAMNERFINIKVDREERPDLDQIYQTVCQLLTRSGGWPLTVFLTPQGEPYFAGTYFPPDERYGRPGFKEVLQAMADAYHTARDQVAEQAKRILEVLGQVQGGQAGTLDESILDHAYESLRGSFDQINGGFGDAPKFPNPFNLELFLRHYARSMEPDALANVVHACRCMRAGGLYDQLGGGFHRYSVDGEWRVPHFEKMLYDNALLANVYLSAWQASAQDDLAATVRETLDYLLAELRHPSGGFYSATDADSEGEEGKFFVWTQDEVEAALEPALAALVCERFGITRRGNFEGGATVLNVARTVEELAAGRGQTPTQVRDALEDARRTLLEVRARREPPFRDEKILASWNGLTLSALARAGMVLGEPRYLTAATELARFLTDTMALGGHLYRVCKDGVVKVPGYLDDYGAVVGGLLDLFAATGHAEWFRQAAALTETVLAEFSDGEAGDFYMTAVGAEPLVVRPKDIHDGAVPSGLSLTAHNLIRLWHLTGEDRYRTRVQQALRAHAETMRNNAWGSAWLVCALDSLLAAPQSVVVVGDGQEAESLLAAASANYRPHLLVCRREADTPEHDLPPLLRGRRLVGGHAAAYACREFACQAPVTDAEALLAALDSPT